jgi:hypothetical protein
MVTQIIMVQVSLATTPADVGALMSVRCGVVFEIAGFLVDFATSFVQADVVGA